MGVHIRAHVRRAARRRIVGPWSTYKGTCKVKHKGTDKDTYIYISICIYIYIYIYVI